MKMILSISLSLMMIALLFTGCAKAKDAAEAAVSEAIEVAESGESAESVAEEAAQAVESGSSGDTASDFYGAYIEAKSAVLDRLMDGLGNNSDTLMSTMSFLGVALSDLYLLPAMYFGLGETSVASALAVMGAKDVTYNEQGNQYTITYKDSNEKQASLTGTYDKGKSLVVTGTTDGAENVYAQVYRTAFGYVGQFYFIADDGTATLYQVSVSGADGAFSIATGVDRPGALTGSEGLDFPKSAKEWYAISGNTITGVTNEGKSVNFEYVPSDNEG